MRPNKTLSYDPLDADKLGLLLSFVQKMAEHERMDRRNWITGSIAATAAVLAATAAITVGVMNLTAKAHSRSAATDQSQEDPR